MRLKYFFQFKRVRKTLTIVEDYSNKINDFTKLRARSIKKKTGIGPLNPEEASIAAQIDRKLMPTRTFLLALL